MYSDVCWEILYESGSEESYPEKVFGILFRASYPFSLWVECSDYSPWRRGFPDLTQDSTKSSLSSVYAGECIISPRDCSCILSGWFPRVYPIWWKYNAIFRPSALSIWSNRIWMSFVNWWIGSWSDSSGWRVYYCCHGKRIESFISKDSCLSVWSDFGTGRSDSLSLSSWYASFHVHISPEEWDYCSAQFLNFSGGSKESFGLIDHRTNRPWYRERCFCCPSRYWASEFSMM